MNTKFVGIKDFRQNISDYVTKAQKGEGHYIVMKRNKPLFEVKPFAYDSDGIYLDSVVEDISKAKKEIAAGEFVTHEDLVKELGL